MPSKELGNLADDMLKFDGITNNTIAMLGGFWSKIPRESDGTVRDDVDKARMQLIQQLLAAMLNVGAFGTTSYDDLITDGIDAFNDDSISVTEIMDLASAISAVTFEGDEELIPGGVPDTAQPGKAKDIAEIDLWDDIP